MVTTQNQLPGLGLIRLLQDAADNYLQLPIAAERLSLISELKRERGQITVFCGGHGSRRSGVMSEIEPLMLIQRTQ